MSPPLRTRTFHWSDPAALALAARDSDGLSFLRALIARGPDEGSAPSAQCLGFRLVEAERGRAVFELTPAEFHYNPLGTVHGGVLSTLCDSAMGAAVHSTLAHGEGYTTLELKVSFLRPVAVATGPVRCEGTLLSRGARVSSAQASLRDAAGTLLAHATSTCLVFPAPQR
jgi:uncharacterized protein (TIGR00369 family)